MLKFKLYLNLVLSFLLIAGSIPAQALSPTTSALVQKNYLANGGFENGPVGFKTYKNAAQATPVTGLGGTPATTMTTTTLTPIADKTSALFTHTAANLQGEGVALPFALEPRARAKLLTISGSYQIVSGTYSGGASTTDSDVEVYVYDVDAGQLIQPTAYKLDGGVIGQIYTISAQFQSSLASSNYRLIFHNASTTTSAFQLKLDELVVGSQSKTFGTTRGPIGSIISSASGTTPTGYLPANGALVSRTQYSALFLAIGTTYGAGDGSTTFTLPNLSGVFARGAGSQTIGGIGYSATLGASQSDLMQGHFHSFAGGSTSPSGTTTYIVTAASPNSGGTIGGPVSDGTNGTPRTGPETRPANVTVAYYICYDAGTTAAADSGDGRVIAARISASGTSLTFNTSLPTLVFPTVEADTHNAYNSSTGVYTAPVSGYYQIDAQSFLIGSNFTANCSLSVNVYRNGTNVGIASQLRMSNSSTIPIFNPQFSGSTKLFFNAGDQITFRGYSDVSATSTNGVATGNNISISRLSANSQILAGESVNAGYVNTSGQSIPGAVMTTVTNWSKTKDTHGFFNPTTGVGTIPISGTYAFEFTNAYASSATSNNTQLRIYKNGTVFKYVVTATPTRYLADYLSITSVAAPFLAGDTFQFIVFQNSGASVPLDASGLAVTMSILKVGN